jgi:hypothetical protein
VLIGPAAVVQDDQPFSFALRWALNIGKLAHAVSIAGRPRRLAVAAGPRLG